MKKLRRTIEVYLSLICSEPFLAQPWFTAYCLCFEVIFEINSTVGEI